VVKFDWYQATIPQHLDDVFEAMLELSSSPRLVHTKGRQTYATVTRIEDDEEGLLAQVQHGGAQAYANVICSGGSAVAGSELIRARFPVHSPTRLDAKEDFGGADTFDRFKVPLLEVADRNNVKVDGRGDHFLRMMARTLYLGSSSSVVQGKLYDKAAELRSQFKSDPVKLAALPEHLTRFEASVRPATPAAKARCAVMEPEQLMGSSKWLGEAWKELSGQDVERVNMGKLWRLSDDDRAYGFMLQQYGAMLARRVEDHGSWCALGQQIGQDLEERARAQRLARRGKR
jgi:hypothetical protein